MRSSSLPWFRFPPRQVVLFIGAVVVPCTALIATGARMLSQDRELADKRDADELRRVAASAGQLILSRLEQLRSREERSRAGNYADSLTVLVATVAQGRLHFPWHGTAMVIDDRFGALIARGQRLESTNRASALATFDSAARTTRDEQRSAWAQMLAARAAAGGRDASRLDRMRSVAQSPFRLRDEYGVPIALYAQRRLVDEAAAPGDEFARRLERDLLPSRALSPAACSLALTLVPRDREHCTYLENAADIGEAWQRSWTTDSTWALDASRTLLYSASPSALTIARLDRVVAELAALKLPIRIAAGSDSGVALSVFMPGLRAIAQSGVTVSMAQWRSKRDFYMAGLTVILVIGLSVAFFLWRDTQREIRLAVTRSQFVSGVSHELKTPLTAIRMYAETLRAGRPRDPAAREQYLDTIVAESERLSRLLDNVLDFAKIERGTKSYALQVRPLSIVVDDVRRIMEHALAQQGFALDIEIDPDVPPVAMDSDAVEQAVLNLVVNAMKYSGNSRRISLRVARGPGAAIVTVADSGIGIAASEKARIFEQFYRAPGPQRAAVPGAGLGLTIVAHVAAAHHGRVSVESREGVGSEFSLHLPLPGSDRATVVAAMAP